MTLENQNIGSEYGIEKRIPGMEGWIPIITPGAGFETYEEAYQKALKCVEIRNRIGYTYTTKFRVVVYDYDGSKRKNIRIITTVTELEPWVDKAVNEMIDIAPTKKEEKMRKSKIKNIKMECPYCKKIFLISKNQQLDNLKFLCTFCRRYNQGCIERVDGVLLGLALSSSFRR